jgi:transposase InsO family protein/transposase-like protein
MRAVELYLKYDMNIAAVIRELGYPSRQMLYLWYSEYKRNGSLHSDCERAHSKYSDHQRKQAIEYYQEHGRSLSRTIKVLGFPKRTTLRDWIRDDLPDNEKHCFTGKTLVRYTEEQKEQAVIRLCAGESTAKEIAAELGATEGSVNRWKRCLLHERCRDKVPKGKASKVAEAGGSGDNIESLKAEKQSLSQQVEELKNEVFQLQLERDILEKAGEILKKGQGINPETLTNREKAVLIDALRDKYRLELLLSTLRIAKSSYCYQECVLQSPDKYASLRMRVKEIFTEANSCYGYRRIHAVLRREGICISEKVVRRIMKEEQLAMPFVKKKKYNSYMGEITPEVDNLINRDFSADAPNVKWLTDITEFSISAGKIYLSPIVDCFDGMAVSWTIGTSPDADMVNSMLDAAVSTLGEDERPVIHSDRGGHYRWPGWIERMQKAELTRSMSKKGCSPDNAACEGFFGRLKNEMFYGRSWVGVSQDDFIHTLDSYLVWHNEKRIKMSLGAKSPLEYRQSLGIAE